MQLPDLSDVKGVIFDMDGTLLESQLNFRQIRQDIGCPPTEDVLAFIDGHSCPQTRAKLHKIVIQHEMNDAQQASWLPIGKAMYQAAIEQELPVALVTRNCREATQMKLSQNNLSFDLVYTREDAPAKPDPAALLLVAQQWQLNPADLIYIGDYIYDRHAAENAGMQWWLVE